MDLLINSQLLETVLSVHLQALDAALQSLTKEELLLLVQITLKYDLISLIKKKRWSAEEVQLKMSLDISLIRSCC